MSPRRPLVVLLALLAVFALVAASCGDDSATEGSSPEDTVPDPTSPSDDDDDVTADGNELAVDFCALSGEANAAGDRFDPTIATAAEVETYFRGQLALAEQGVEVAPDTIVDEITAQRDVLADAIAMLEPVEWDIMGNLDAVIGLYETDEFVTAADQLDRFDIEVCGFTDDADVTTDDEVTAPGRTPEENAYCSFSAEMGGRGGIPADGTAADVEAYYGLLLADLEQASSLATADLVADYGVVIEVFGELAAIMEDAAFDVDVAQPAVDEYSSDPDVSIPMEAAIENIEAYDTAVCGLG